MNTEKLKQLKPGDEIFIRAKYEKTLDDGDVRFSCSVTDERNNVTTDVGYAHPSIVILTPSAPKYDPCRPFKKDDIVTPIERDGREVPDGAPVGEKCTVVEPEKNGIVCIRYDAGSEHYIHEIPYFRLELITPVEEIEPYSMGETSDYFSVDKDDEELCLYWKDKHPNPKEAAEAECDRLNAEHRKGEK